MLNILKWFLKALPAFIMGAIVFAAGTPPDSAVSNLSKWAELFGINLPSILEQKVADIWIIRICIIGIALNIIIMVYLGLHRRKKKHQQKPKSKKLKNGEGELIKCQKVFLLPKPRNPNFHPYTASIELKNISTKELFIEWGKFKYSSGESGPRIYFQDKPSRGSSSSRQIKIKKDGVFYILTDITESLQSNIESLIYKVKGYKKEKISLEFELSNLSTEMKNERIKIRRFGDQVHQTINGKTLAVKWGIEPYHLLDMVKNLYITAYTPDEGVDIIANETEQEFEKSMGFYSQENETDEDTVLRLKFKPQDIREFEEKVRSNLFPEYVLLRIKWKRITKRKKEDMKKK